MEYYKSCKIEREFEAEFKLLVPISAEMLLVFDSSSVESHLSSFTIELKMAQCQLASDVLPRSDK